MIFNRLKLAVDRVIAAFSVAVMLALVVCVVWQVFSRYILNQPSTLTDELARFLMIWVGLLGAALGTAIYIALVGILPGVFSGINDYKYIITIGVALVFGSL